MLDMEIRQALATLLREVELIPTLTEVPDGADTETRLRALVKREVETRARICRELSCIVERIDAGAESQQRPATVRDMDDHARLCLALDWVHNLMDNARWGIEYLKDIPRDQFEDLPKEAREQIEATLTVLDFWEPPHLLQPKGRF